MRKVTLDDISPKISPTVASLLSVICSNVRGFQFFSCITPTIQTESFNFGRGTTMKSQNSNLQKIHKSIQVVLKSTEQQKNRVLTSYKKERTW